MIDFKTFVLSRRPGKNRRRAAFLRYIARAFEAQPHFEPSVWSGLECFMIFWEADPGLIYAAKQVWYEWEKLKRAELARDPCGLGALAVCRMKPPRSIEWHGEVWSVH
jgi:hypothetical protein